MSRDTCRIMGRWKNLTNIVLKWCYWCENGWDCFWGKIIFKILGLTFSSKLDSGLYIISIARTASKKIENWTQFILWSFFFLRLLCVSVNQLCPHVWNTIVMSGLVLLVATWNCWRCSSELAQLVSLPYSWGRSFRYSDRSHDFSVTIPRCYKDVYVNIFFPYTARLWNSPPIGCFPWTYDLSGFKSRINRHLFSVDSN